MQAFRYTGAALMLAGFLLPQHVSITVILVGALVVLVGGKRPKPEPELIATQGDYHRLGYQFGALDKDDLEMVMGLLVETGAESAPMTKAQRENLLEMPEWQEARKSGRLRIKPLGGRQAQAHADNAQRAYMDRLNAVDIPRGKYDGKITTECPDEVWGD